MTAAQKLGLTSLLALIGFMTAPVLVSAEEFKERGLTLGPRAQFFDPKEGEGDWSGGAQTRFYFNESIALEGSIDYRREEFGETDVDIYPVQASLLAYIIEAKPVGLFALGGA